MIPPERHYSFIVNPCREELIRLRRAGLDNLTARYALIQYLTDQIGMLLDEVDDRSAGRIRDEVMNAVAHKKLHRFRKSVNELIAIAVEARVVRILDRPERYPVAEGEQ